MTDPKTHPALRSWMLPTLATVGALVQVFRFRDPGYGIDDAWISFRIARNWVRGDGLTFNPGEPPVEGMTNLLWTLLSGAWLALFPDSDPMLWARSMGILLFMATVGLTVHLVGSIATRMGREGTLSQLVTGAILVTSGSLAYHSASGLETALWGFLFVVTLTGVRLALEEHKWAILGAGLGLGALAATRPEGVLVGSLFCGAGLWYFGRRAWIGIAAFGVLVASMEWFRWSYYGAWVPNTFHAKPPNPSEGWRYGWDFLCFGLGVTGLWIWIASWRAYPWTRFLVGLCLILTAGTIWSGGDWMAGHRRFTLVIWATAILAGGLVAQPSTRFSGLLGAAGCIIGPTVLSVMKPTAGLTNPDVLTEIAVKAEAESLTSIALVDIGLVGWLFDGPIYDMVGLTDRHIASRSGLVNEKEWDEGYFRAHNPDLVLIRSETEITDPLESMPSIGHPDDKVLLSILEHGGYHLRAISSFGSERHILIFLRDDIELSEDLWGPMPTKGLRQLIVEFHER